MVRTFGTTGIGFWPLIPKQSDTGEPGKDKKVYRPLTYLKHLLTATNQHGVHSPFIYDFLTKCLYSKERYATKIQTNILLKSIPYFGVKTLLLASGRETMEQVVREKFPDIQFNAPTYDAIYLNTPDIETFKKLIGEGNRIHNDTLLFINHIHNGKSASLRWEQLKLHGQARVTLDLFYCGIVFFRKEQAEEHFKIRI